MNTVYLQCDCRYNKCLLKNIGEGGKCVGYTIERCKRIESVHLIAGIYACPENENLIKVLEVSGVECILSDEVSANKRFLNIVSELDTRYIVRVGGDQVLIDTDRINNILLEMENTDKEWFYEEISGSILPDIIAKECLVRYYDELKMEDRYFEKLLKIQEVKRFKLSYPMLLPYDFRINSDNGFRVCKSILDGKLNIYDISEKMLKKVFGKGNYLWKNGMLASWIIPPENSDHFYNAEDGTANPWLSNTAIDLIKQRVGWNMQVFEWGTGNSTLFWSRYVKTVVSIEHDQAWYMKIKDIVPSNVMLKWVELEYGGTYCQEILKMDHNFDIILIDGRDRVNCAINAVRKLTPTGVIIWDNSERAEYKEGIGYLKAEGFKQLELSGLLHGYPEVVGYTSIFYRTENIFGL